MADAFTNRVVLITGAGSGIGRQLALQLRQRGAVIAAVDLAPGPLESLLRELDCPRSASAVADVTDMSALQTAVKQLEVKAGPVDVLIANAGIGRETSALHYPPADFEAQVRVNLIGVSNSVAAVLPGMIERKRGHLVGISSLASYRGLPVMAGYCAAKAGVNALMDSLRVELEPLGLCVTTICPGWIRTPLTQSVNVPQPDMLSVEDAVKKILWAIERKRAFYAFPWRSAWRVWLVRWLPARWGDAVVRAMLARLAKQERKG